VLARISPDQLAEILDIAEDGIVTADARQEIVLFNRGAAKIFGYTPEEVVGQPLELLLPARFRAPHRGQVEGFAKAPASARLMGERREVYGRRKDGAEFPAEVSISKFGTGAEVLFTAIVRDVTERKRYEAAQRELEHLRAKAELADTRAKLDAVIRSAQDAIVILDADLKTTLFNPAAEQVFGYPAEHAAGAHVARFLPDGLPTDATKSTAPQEVEGRRVDGKPVPLEVSSSRTEVGGEAVHTLILRDVTDRKRAEEELRETAKQREQALTELRATTQQLWQAARLAGVGELAASIAHELNNPLGTVSLRVEGVLAKTPADDPRRKALEVIEQEVERMGNLVANLLQFSRAGRDQVSTVDVCEEVTKTIDLVAHHLRKRQIRVESDFGAGVPIIHADRQQLRQVFLNLFTNAADAMPGGGRLVPRVRTGALPGSIPAIVIEVTDTGGGIPADLLSRVFDPFFTTKEEGKGTGLGLAICKRIIEQHHGKLEIESTLGAGTTVRVTLPIRPETNVVSLRKE
jgi:PAS domain S-box-containing protein